MKWKIRETHEKTFKNKVCRVMVDLMSYITEIENSLKRCWTEAIILGSNAMSRVALLTGTLCFQVEELALRDRRSQGRQISASWRLSKVALVIGTTVLRLNGFSWKVVGSTLTNGHWIPLVMDTRGKIWQWVAVMILKVGPFQLSDSVIPRKEQGDTRTFALF